MQRATLLFYKYIMFQPKNDMASGKHQLVIWKAPTCSGWQRTRPCIGLVVKEYDISSWSLILLGKGKHGIFLVYNNQYPPKKKGGVVST